MRMKWINECKTLSTMFGMKIDSNDSYHHHRHIFRWWAPIKSCSGPVLANKWEWTEMTLKLFVPRSGCPPKENDERGNAECWAPKYFSAYRFWDWQAFDGALSPSSFAVSSKTSALHPALAPALDLWPCFLLLWQVSHAGFIIACPKISSEEDHTHFSINERLFLGVRESLYIVCPLPLVWSRSSSGSGWRMTYTLSLCLFLHGGNEIAKEPWTRQNWPQSSI